MGVVFGIICYYAMPSIIPAENVVVVMVIGGASGLSAAGTNQIVKQLGKTGGDNKIADEKETGGEKDEPEKDESEKTDG